MYPKNTVFFLSNTHTFKRIIAISLKHHTLDIHISFNFTDIVHNKCNSHAFYQRFQSKYFSKKYKLPPKLTSNLYPKKILRLNNDTLKPCTASTNDILKLLDPPPPRVIFFWEYHPWAITRQEKFKDQVTDRSSGMGPLKIAFTVIKLTKIIINPLNHKYIRLHNCCWILLNCL